MNKSFIAWNLNLMELENIPTDANKKISAIFSHLITKVYQSNKSIGLEKVRERKLLGIEGNEKEKKKLVFNDPISSPPTRSNEFRNAGKQR